MTNLVVDQLARAAKSRGSQPLITWYGAAGERTELTVRSFANWVDKTTNLLLDLDLDEVVVTGAVSREHPGHWMSLIWPLATWQAGGSYHEDGLGTVTVIGPEHPAAVPGSVTFACSLHPLGLGLSGLPVGVSDFTGEALAQPDTHVQQPVGDTEAAWLEPGHVHTHAELATIAPTAGRRLIRPGTAWTTLVEAVIAPVLGGGSSVIVEGDLAADAVARLMASEHIRG